MSILGLGAAVWVLAIPTYGSYRPTQITPAWYVQHFPGCLDRCGSRTDEFQQLVLWHSVRQRPDLVTAMIRVINDSSVSHFTRGRAVYILGTTGQRRAQEFLIEMLARQRPGDQFRGNAIWSLAGSGPPLPESGYQVLAQVLREGEPASDVGQDRDWAVMALARLRTEQARQILSQQLHRETDPYIRDSIRRSLRAWNTLW